MSPIAAPEVAGKTVGVTEEVAGAIVGAPVALGRAVVGAAGRVVGEVEDAADATVSAVKGTLKSASDKVTDTAESALDSVNDAVSILVLKQMHHIGMCNCCICTCREAVKSSSEHLTSYKKYFLCWIVKLISKALSAVHKSTPMV